MSDMNWSCCPLVAQTPTTRAFIEQLVRERKSPSTIENYSRDLNDFLSAFPDIPFADLLEADETLIAQYMDWLWTRDAQRGSGKSVDRGNITYLIGSKLAPATIRRRISALRSFYRWAIRLRQRLDPINPVREGVRGQERGLVSVPWIPDERQWKAILKYVLTRLSIRDQAIVLLAHDGALRREEIVLLRVDDIDRRTHTIAIRAEITKNHMPGIIVLSHPTWTRLKAYLEEDRAALVKYYGAEANGPIFLSDSHRNPGQPLTKWTVKDIFDRISDALHIPQLTPHKMRHLMLTELKKGGMELLDVSRYARHRRMSTRKSICTPTCLTWRARSTKPMSVSPRSLSKWRQKLMMNASAASQSRQFPQERHMPIVPDNYPDRSPQITNDEKRLMEQYVSAAGKTMTGGRAKRIFDQLVRFEQPYVDTVRLIAHTRNLSIGRRHLFTFMIQTELAFWAWPKEVWIEVIQTTPKKLQPQGVRLWMTLLAYFFGGFLYVGASTSYGFIADIIFGKTRMDAEVDKLYAPLRSIGYDKESGGYHRFRWTTAFTLLINRHPAPEALSASTLVMVYELVAQVASIGRIRGRRALMHLQLALCELDILDEPAIVGPTREASSHPLALLKDDESVDPLWLAWIRAFCEQTPRYSERMLRHTCYHLLTAGRWLKKTHPEVKEPAQWDEVLAWEYVTYTCQALRGDQALPSNTRYARYQASPQQLKPGAIRARLYAMRAFFSQLQRQTYVVQGKPRLKTQLSWLPQEVFKLPDDVRAALQPNPRDIAEDAWFKLIWAACTLSKEHLRVARMSIYPLAYYRAASLIWVTAARRSDEIRRLQVGCMRREWAPEMRDEQGNQLEPEADLAYIRIPTNKFRGEFFIPVPSYVADAIEVWESVRPRTKKC